VLAAVRQLKIAHPKVRLQTVAFGSGADATALISMANAGAGDFHVAKVVYTYILTRAASAVPCIALTYLCSQALVTKTDGESLKETFVQISMEAATLVGSSAYMAAAALYFYRMMTSFPVFCGLRIAPLELAQSIATTCLASVGIGFWLCSVFDITQEKYVQSVCIEHVNLDETVHPSTEHSTYCCPHFSLFSFFHSLGPIPGLLVLFLAFLMSIRAVSIYYARVAILSLAATSVLGIPLLFYALQLTTPIIYFATVSFPWRAGITLATGIPGGADHTCDPGGSVPAEQASKLVGTIFHGDGANTKFHGTCACDLKVGSDTSLMDIFNASPTCVPEHTLMFSLVPHHVYECIVHSVCVQCMSTLGLNIHKLPGLSQHADDRAALVPHLLLVDHLAFVWSAILHFLGQLGRPS
jgi:hypothetical protein